MKRILTISLLTLMILSVSCSMNCGKYEMIEDSKSDKEIIVGQTCIDKWMEITGWQMPDNYTPNPQVVHHIYSQMQKRDITFIIIGATWCDDSEKEMPKLFKLFKKLDVSGSKYELYGVDRSKNETTGKVAQLNIERVPTLIMYEDGKEKGRIVETPLVEWDEDLLPLINK